MILPTLTGRQEHLAWMEPQQVRYQLTIFTTELAPFYIHITCTNVSWILLTPSLLTSVCWNVHAHAHIHARAHVHAHIHAHVHAHVHAHAHTGQHPAGPSALLHLCLLLSTHCALLAAWVTWYRLEKKKILNSKTANAKVSAFVCAIPQIWKMSAICQYFYKYLVMGANPGKSEPAIHKVLEQTMQMTMN